MKKLSIRRPKSVTFLALFIFIIAMLNLIRTAQVIKQWPFLTAVLTNPPYYQLITGIIWGFLGLLFSWGAWCGWRRIPIFIISGAICFSLFLWMDKLVVSPAPFDSNWLFILIINGLFLVYIMWSLTRLNTKAYFGVAYDSKSQDR